MKAERAIFFPPEEENFPFLNESPFISFLSYKKKTPDDDEEFFLHVRFQRIPKQFKTLNKKKQDNKIFQK